MTTSVKGQDDDDEGRHEYGETRTWNDANVERRKSGVTREWKRRIVRLETMAIA